MAKRDRILGYFPSFYRAGDTTKLLHEAVTNLARPLEEADTHLFRIQRAHRLKVAEDPGDIVKLSAALNLTAFHFEDIQVDKNLSYQEKLQLMRSRVQRIARIYLTGLGTPWAVIEAAATFLNATIVPEFPGEPLIKHLDGDYFSHKAAIEFTHRQEVLSSVDITLESELNAGNAVSEKLWQALTNSGLSLSKNSSIFPAENDHVWRLADRERGREYTIKKQVDKLNVYRKPRECIYLHENLFHRKKVEPAERWQMNSWIAENKNVEASRPRFVIQGVADHTVLPSVFCPSTREGFLFNGVIPAGKTLLVDPFNGAFIEDQPADEWIVSFKGSIFDVGLNDSATFVTERKESSTPFFGVLEDVVSSAIPRKIDLPMVPVGPSEWFFKVGDGLYDGSDFDLSVYETRTDPTGIYDQDFSFDECLFDFPGAGIIGMGWDETIPCSFKLLLPATPDAGDYDSQSPAVNYLSRVGAILPSFRAAGVRSLVDSAKDAWILGESMVRDSGATKGKGVERQATRLRNQLADRLVPLESNN
jgi:hypothetical protein